MTAAAVTGLSGMFAFLISDKLIFIPPMVSAGGGGAEQAFSSQVTVRPSAVASRRDNMRSGFPLSTQPRTVCDVPSGSETVMSITMRLWSRVMGTVADLGSGWRPVLVPFCANALAAISQAQTKTETRGRIRRL